MARPRQKRVIQQPPKVKGFNPLGYYSSKNSSIKLNLEEFECIRLLDFEGLSQEEAAEFMHVSRPTLTRIYEKARIKIAKTLIDGNQLLIEGGDFVFKENWYLCLQCHSKFNSPEKQSFTPALFVQVRRLKLLEKDDICHTHKKQKHQRPHIKAVCAFSILCYFLLNNKGGVLHR
jgi:predicted DNA-binding protein (UPF0251 family)